MVLELQLPERVGVGEPVRMTLGLANTGREPVPLTLTGRPTAFDLVVSRPDGAEVWSRLRGAVVPMVLQLRTLEPGETLEYEDEWDQRDNEGRAVEPGTYQVRGMLPSEERNLVSEPRTLVIHR